MSRAVATALCLAGVLAVSACSGSEDGPKTLPPLPSKSATPSLSPAAAPSLPPGAAAADAEGATAFIRFWFERVEVAYVAGNAELLSEFSDPSCNTCTRLTTDIQRVGREGHIFSGKQFRLTEVEAAMPLANGDVLAELVYESESLTELDGQGKTVFSAEPREARGLQVRLVRHEAGWLMRGIREL